MKKPPGRRNGYPGNPLDSRKRFPGRHAVGWEPSPSSLHSQPPGFFLLLVPQSCFDVNPVVDFSLHEGWQKMHIFCRLNSPLLSDLPGMSQEIRSCLVLSQRLSDYDYAICAEPNGLKITLNRRARIEIARVKKPIGLWPQLVLNVLNQDRLMPFRTREFC